LKILSYEPPKADLGPLIANMNSEFANFIMHGKLKNLRVFLSGRARRSIHPGHHFGMEGVDLLNCASLDHILDIVRKSFVRRHVWIKAFFLASWCHIALEKNNLAKEWQQIVKFFAKKLTTRKNLG